jgi:Ni/Fe-hydrogenase subunit HybB-like protein
VVGVSDDSEGATGEDASKGPNVDVQTVLAYLSWGGLVALGILAVVAGIGLYTSLSAVIDVWVADRFQPFARIGLNFAVLCASIAGMVALLRRVR